MSAKHNKTKYISIIFVNFTLSLCINNNAVALQINPDKIKVKNNKEQILVVQNRYFLKKLRPELGIFYGRIMNEAYTKTIYTGYRFGLFLTENFGTEISTFSTSVTDSEDRKALNQLQYKDIATNKLVSPDPEINTVYSENSFSLFFSPLYGKINLFDSHIIYTDTYLNLGYSLLSTKQGPIQAVTYGAGQRLYFTKSLSFRWDIKLKRYTETRDGVPSSKTGTNIDFGLSYFIF